MLRHRRCVLGQLCSIVVFKLFCLVVCFRSESSFPINSSELGVSFAISPAVSCLSTNLTPPVDDRYHFYSFAWCYPIHNFIYMKANASQMCLLRVGGARRSRIRRIIVRVWSGAEDNEKSFCLYAVIGLIQIAHALVYVHVCGDFFVFCLVHVLF